MRDGKAGEEVGKKKLGEFFGGGGRRRVRVFFGCEREKIHLIKLYRARYDIFFLGKFSLHSPLCENVKRHFRTSEQEEDEKETERISSLAASGDEARVECWILHKFQISAISMGNS